MLVDKGFFKPRGFFCLNKIVKEFNRYFTADEIEETIPKGFNYEFSPILEKLYVRKKIF